MRQLAWHVFIPSLLVAPNQLVRRRAYSTQLHPWSRPCNARRRLRSLPGETRRTNHDYRYLDRSHPSSPAAIARPGCRACADRNFEYLNASRRAPISLCGRNAVQIHERMRPLDLVALRRSLEPLGDVRANEFALRFFPDSVRDDRLS